LPPLNILSWPLQIAWVSGQPQVFVSGMKTNGGVQAWQVQSDERKTLLCAAQLLLLRLHLHCPVAGSKILFVPQASQRQEPALKILPSSAQLSLLNMHLHF